MQHFYRHQKVVCINDTFNDPRWYKHVSNFPVKGNIYTIREILRWNYINSPNRLAFYLEEIINDHSHCNWSNNPHGKELPFPSERFKPLLDKEISIDVFNQLLLNPSKSLEHSS